VAVGRTHTVSVEGGPSAEVEEGTTLLDALRGAGVPIIASCGGLGLCGLCRVRVLRGSLSPPTSREREVIGSLLAEGWRLACQARVAGDATVSVPQMGGRAEKARRRPRLPLAPPVVTIPLRVGRAQPSLEESILRYLRAVGVAADAVSRRALGKASCMASRGELSGLAVVCGGEVIDVFDSYGVYGVAIDIGTTSVAVSLVDLGSCSVVAEKVGLNEQLRYGADVISRIQYAITVEEGVTALRRAVLDTVNRLIGGFGVDENRIVRATVAGNSVMLHLFHGVNPATLGSLPFEPVYRRGITMGACEAGLAINPEGIVEALPILGGYVGGDVVGDILASRLLESGKALLVDIGTNGEVVVKRGDEMLAASTPAGPAFEGVGLSSGMMAVEGAIERVELEDGEARCSVIGGVEPRGVCGSGYVDLLAELLRHGMLDRSGRLVKGSPGVREVGGVLRFVLDEERGIAVTQVDLRKLQLAVAAIKLTTKFLLKSLDMSPRDLEKVVVAGDFGYHLNPLNAMEVGLLPKVEPEVVDYIGNGSLTGAELYMVSPEARREVAQLVRQCRVVDVDRSQDSFIKELRFGW